MYADDIMLISNKKWKINAALNICEQYGDENQIKWNTTKTQYIEFTKGITGKPRKGDRNRDIKFSGAKINAKIHYRFQQTRIKTRNKIYLYKTLARVILTYGLKSNVLFKSNRRTIQQTEGNLMKGLLKLSRKSKTKNLLAAVKIEPISNKIDIHKLNFLTRISENKITRKITNTRIHLTRKIPTMIDEVLEILNRYERNPIELEEIQGPEPENYKKLKEFL